MTCFCAFGGYFLKDDKNMSFRKDEIYETYSKNKCF